MAVLTCIGLAACGSGKASSESYWDSRKDCLSDLGMEELQNSVWPDFGNTGSATLKPTYIAIDSLSRDTANVWYGVNYQYAKATDSEFYEDTNNNAYVPYIFLPCTVEYEDGRVCFRACEDMPWGTVYDELRYFSCYVYEDSKMMLEYSVNGETGTLYHGSQYWGMDADGIYEEIATLVEMNDSLDSGFGGNDTPAGGTTAPTPTPTPTPTPLLNPEVCEKLTGQTWKLESVNKTNRGYGEPKEIIIDSISPESAKVTYVVNTGTVDGDCMGLQYEDGKYYLELECDVKESTRGSIILTSKKQMREFHAYSNKKDPLCVIEIYPSKIESMACTFYSWERELVLVEKLPEIGKEYSGTIYGRLDSIGLFQEMSAAVTKDHELYMWGYKALNYVADNPIKGTAIEPTLVAEGVIKVFPGSNSGFVIKEDNSLWGFNDYSEYAVWDESLDFYERLDREPYLNKIADNVKTVTCDGSIIAYVREDGTVVVLEDAFACSKSEIEKITNVKKICSGHNFVLVLKEDGTLSGLGDNREEVLGIEDKEDYQKSYVQIMSDVADVEVSSGTTFVVKTDGSLWGWGSNSSGQLGQWDFADRKLPVKIMDDVAAISYDGGTIYAITKDAALYIWGGAGPISDTSNHPKKYVSNVVAAEENMGVLMVVKGDGILYTAGYNGNKQLGYLTDDSRTEKLRKCLENILLPGEND